MKKRIITLGLIISLLGQGGCGYTTRPNATPGINKIYVDNFKNKVYESTLDVVLTTAVIHAFINDGFYKIVKKEDADAIISGEIINYEASPLRYDENDNAEEYRMTITVDLQFFNLAENNLVWRERSFSGETTYFTTGAGAKSEQAAKLDAVKDLAQRIIDRTVETW
ncbi:MAG: LptE family protein [Candidatus Omnitrophota bacterium]